MGKAYGPQAVGAVLVCKPFANGLGLVVSKITVNPVKIKRFQDVRPGLQECVPVVYL